MTSNDKLCAIFTEKAQAVSAIVTEVADMEAAIARAMELCAEKEACKLLVSGCEESLSRGAETLCAAKRDKIVAAPGLDKAAYETLAAQCASRGFVCLDSGLRNHLAGVDIGFTVAQAGIAETGTLVLDSRDEELRLATMIAELHVCVLKKTDIVADSLDLEETLARTMGRTPDYTAFITGASRTADIERVLALGVHGPLELHILLMEG